MNKKTISIIVAVVVLLVIAYFAFMVKPKQEEQPQEQTQTQESVDNESTNTASLIPEAVQQTETLKLLHAEFIKTGNDQRAVTGVIKNMTDRIYSPVEAQLTLFDDKGKVVATKSTSVALLEAGLSWAFEIPVIETQATRFEVKVFSPEKVDASWKIE